VFAISPKDQEWYVSHGADAMVLPPFHGYTTIDILPGRGTYLLYQGDLSLEINQGALLDLLEQWDHRYPIIVAGLSGDRSFEEKLTHFPNLQREKDVSDARMTALIKGAQIVLLHSLHGSGMKLKLFPALFHGRFIAGSPANKTHLPIDEAIHFYEKKTLLSVINALWERDFTEKDFSLRSQIMATLPTDSDKAIEIMRYL
jgi:hypothetical protein